jgi:hypothetical protein
MRPGILFSQMEPPPGGEDRFQEWYETEHIPARLAIDGFDLAIRYHAIEGSPAYLAIYHLSDLAALDTSDYQHLKEAPSERTREILSVVRGFTRYTCAQVFDSGRSGAHRYLSVVAFAVPDSDVSEFDEWYETEHIPALLKEKDWLRVCRYRVLSGEGGPWTHLALHELASLEAMGSPARAAARQGVLRDKLARRPWFGQSGRWLYEVLSTHG